MRVTANLIDDSFGEFEASITTVLRCDCGGSLRACASDVDEASDSAWTESPNLVVVPLTCTKCGASHCLHVNIRSGESYANRPDTS